jgi:hypothetical protein
MKIKVTLKIDTDLLQQARALAALDGRSVRSLLSDRLEQIVGGCNR